MSLTQVAQKPKPHLKTTFSLALQVKSIIHVPQSLSEYYGLNAGFHYGVKATSVTPDNDDICFGDDNCPSHYNPDQEDNYPPGGNGIGDACDCEANFDCDQDVDANDVTAFLTDFGRSQYYRPCSNEDPCKGDFSCDGDVDASDVTKFLEDFGRSQYYNPCPACVAGAWCVYPQRKKKFLKKLSKITHTQASQHGLSLPYLAYNERFSDRR